MTVTSIALLPDRGVVSVTGGDAGKLLQGLISNDMALLGLAPAIHAGLLTPQGKILFDFFVVKTADGYLLDTPRDKVADLVKRLLMYKLRADVTISDVSADYRVLAAWGENAGSQRESAPAISFADPRLPALGLRLLAKATASAASDGTTASPDDYLVHRIALGVPEGGKDFAYGDSYPHEALFDQLGGVSFTKGCYVGQEVVSRMEHRATARKRIVPVLGESPLPASGADIKAGEVTIGTLGSVAGNRGLALLRVDRVAEAIAQGTGLFAGSVPIKVELPSFAKFTLAAQPAPA